MNRRAIRPDTPCVRCDVLVVDDETDIVDLLTIWLEDDPRCTSVVQATDLDAAVVTAQHAHPDVIVLDFFFGHRVAAEILPVLREVCPDAFIVVHTASRRAAEAAGVTTLGADLVIEKSSTGIDELIDRVLGDALLRISSRG